MKLSRTPLPSLALLTLLLAGCGGSADPDTGSVPAPPPVTLSGPVQGVHPVQCGCVIEGIGHCGNYAVVEGQVVPLGGDIGLGKMEFCGREGLSAAIEGEVVDGTLVATTFELVE